MVFRYVCSIVYPRSSSRDLLGRSIDYLYKVSLIGCNLDILTLQLIYNIILSNDLTIFKITKAAKYSKRIIKKNTF